MDESNFHKLIIENLIYLVNSNKCQILIINFEYKILRDKIFFAMIFTLYEKYK